MILFNKKNNSGFTLIELLAVVSIIGLLTSIVLSSLSTAKAKARDARRLEDMRTLQTAINLYQNDHGGNLPDGLNDPGGNNSYEDSRGTNYSFIKKLYDDKYIPQGILDPINNSVYYYHYNNGKKATPRACGSGPYKAVLEYKLEKTNTIHPNCLDNPPFKCICL